MRGWPGELQEGDFSKRRVVRSAVGAGASAAKVAFEAEVSCLAEMTDDSLVWLWGDVLALGKVTLLTGASGVGKSFVAMDLVAAVTRGERGSNGPDGRAGDAQTAALFSTDDPARISTDDPSPTNCLRRPGDVLLISPEAELVDVVRPRLLSAGADISRVHALRGIRRSPSDNDNADCRAFHLDQDLRLLEHEIARREAAGTPLRLIVIDPFPVELFAYRYGAAELARMMRCLAEIAAGSHVAILLLVDNSTRLTGNWENLSKVLHATAQSVWTIVDGMAVPDSRVFFPYPPNYQGPRDDEPEVDLERLLLVVKANLKRQTTGLSFRLDSGRIAWNAEPVQMSAEEYFARQVDRNQSSKMLLDQEWSELARATHWLKRRLKRGVTPRREIKREALEQDISFSTLRRAFCGLKCITRRIGNSRLWGWALPDNDIETGRLPAWLNVEPNDAGPVGPSPPDFETVGQEQDDPAASVEPRTDGQSTDGTADASERPFGRTSPSDIFCANQSLPDEVVPTPDGGWTWRRLLERTDSENDDESVALTDEETRLPFT